MGRAERERIVREHIDAENRRDADGTVATFEAPRYEVVPTGEVHEGPAEVAGFLTETMHAFPDMIIALHAIHHSEAGVLVEVTFEGTHLGAWRGLPATGKRVTYRMCNVFVFDGDRLMCERLYFDILTALRQLGVARDPASLSGRIATIFNHPITLMKATLRSLLGSGRSGRRLDRAP